MNFQINDLLFLSILFIALLIVYKQIHSFADLSAPFKKTSSRLNRSIRINNYINNVSKQKEDYQKMIFKEGLLIFTIILILYLISAKSIFFTAVVSGSMSPTFDREDLVLMQNIERTYKEGDIILFKEDILNQPVTHRIRYITKDGVRTQGDNNPNLDSWYIKEKDIEGKAIIIGGKPIIIKGYGKYFFVDKKQEFGPFGDDYKKFSLFIQVLKLYGYVIAAGSIFLYILLTVRKSPE